MTDGFDASRPGARGGRHGPGHPRRSCSTATRRSPRSPSCTAGPTDSCWSRSRAASGGPATPSSPPSRARCSATAAATASGGRRATGWTRRRDRRRPARAPGADHAAPSAGRGAGLPRFTGGAVGYLGYDVVRTIESLPHAPAGRPGSARRHPDGDRHAAGARQPVQPRHRHRERRGRRPAPRGRRSRRLFDDAEARIDGWLARLRRARRRAAARHRAGAAAPAASTSPYADDAFQADVRRIKEYIAAGDTFQTVLSRRIDLAAPDPFLTYRYLRALNPAPYLYYLHCDDVHVIGSSPEILVRVEEGEVTLRPIAGTRPRGARRSRTPRSPTSSPPIRRSAPSTSCWSTSAGTTSAGWRSSARCGSPRS